MKYRIIRKDRKGTIVPTPSKEMNFKLLQELSYTKNNTRFLPNPTWGHVQLYNGKTASFPIGLISRVIQIFEEKGHEIRVCPLEPIQVAFSDFLGLREYQIDAIIAMIDHEYGIIKMPTGAGKTRTAIAYINAVKLKTLILVPTLDLVRQWKEQLPESAHVCTYTAIKKKEYVQQFRLVIFDECHHVAAKTLYRIGMNVHKNTRIFGLSATPLDRDDDNLKVEAVLGPIIYEVPLCKLIDEGFLCDAEVFFHDVEPKKYGYLKYSEVYQDYIVENVKRNSQIIKIAEDVVKPCLILVSLIEHGEILKDMLINEDVVFLNGQLKGDERTDIVHDIIIATSIFDEGVDIPALRTLILAAGGKSAIKAVQRVGRLLRPFEGKDKAIIHDFFDRCRWLEDHSKQRFEIFQENFEVNMK